MKSPNVPTATNDTPDTDTLSGTNPLDNKYMAINTFDLNYFLLLQVLLDRAQNCVARFLLEPGFTPLGTFEKFNIFILNRNHFFNYPNVNVAVFTNKYIWQLWKLMLDICSIFINITFSKQRYYSSN